MSIRRPLRHPVRCWFIFVSLLQQIPVAPAVLTAVLLFSVPAFSNIAHSHDRSFSGGRTGLTIIPKTSAAVRVRDLAILSSAGVRARPLPPSKFATPAAPHARRDMMNRALTAVWIHETTETDMRDNRAERLAGAMPLYYRLHSDRGTRLSDTDQKGIISDFLQSMSRELMENKGWITLLRDAERMDASDGWRRDHFALYKGEMRDLDYIERDVAVNAISGALMDTVENTPVGTELKRIEEIIRRYMSMKYSKSIYEDEAVFHLPGQKPPDLRPEETEYGVSLSVLVHVDPDSFYLDFGIKMAANWRETVVNGLYDMRNGEASLMLESRPLNKYLDARAALGLIYDPQEDEEESEFAVLATLQWSF